MGETVVRVSSKFRRLSCVIALAALVGCGGESENEPSTSNASDGGTAGTKTGAGGNASGGSSGGSSSGSGGGDTLPEGPPPSVDLLLVIDNSISMGDKQALLSDALPGLVRRLVQPNCVDESGTPVGRSQDSACADGELEFPPVEDLHLGVISSSLGSWWRCLCRRRPGALLQRQGASDRRASGPAFLERFGLLVPGSRRYREHAARRVERREPRLYFRRSRAVPVGKPGAATRPRSRPGTGS